MEDPGASGPIGRSSRQAGAARSGRSAAYRAEAKRLALFEGLARAVVTRRAALGWSQAELARRMGTSHSAISRIESGQHATSVRTLERLAEALGLRLVIGLEEAPARAS